MKWLSVVFCFLCFSSPVLADEPPASLVKLAQERLVDGRYIDNCTAAADGLFKNWPKGVVQKCTYDRTDTFTDGKKPRVVRSYKAVAYMANADAYRLASWINTACSMATDTSKDRQSCFSTTVGAIQGQSGAQFPLAGQVMEDMGCKDGITHSDCVIARHDRKTVICPYRDYAACWAKAKKDGGDDPDSEQNGVNEQYMFRSGVTVRIKDCPNSENSDSQIKDPYATCRDNDALNRTDVPTSIPSGKARIISTTPAMFQLYMRREKPYKIDGQWLQLVEDTYRTALSSDDNPLIDAWVCSASPKWPKGCPQK
jgi:hypothetical protein